MNLSEYVLPDKKFDFKNFANDVQIAVGALNDVLDEGQPLHPLQEQKDSVHDWRQIGLGIMGIADMLIKMEIPYDSDEAIALCDDIGWTLLNAALHKSAMLAKEFGAYPKYEAKYAINDFVKTNCDDSVIDEIKKYGLHNSQLLTIAPTGTLSTMLGISGGIEPIYANYYNRKTESLHDGKEVIYKVYTPIVDKYMKEHDLVEENELPAWFVTSGTINPMKRVDMQATWQKYIDASISSTVNLPNEATTELIGKLYFKAWEEGLKGLTIFRDNCKRAGILTTSNTTDTGENLPRGSIVQCSDDLVGKKRKLVSGCGSLHCLAYFHPTTGKLQEVYLNKGSTGGCLANMNGLSRMISIACRAGVSVYDIKDQLDSTGVCPSYARRSATKHDTSKGSCCPMAVGNALIEMYEEMQKELGNKKEVKAKVTLTLPKAKIKIGKTELETNLSKMTEQEAIDNGKCPICGEPLQYVGGCVQCVCGWSHCG